MSSLTQQVIKSIFALNINQSIIIDISEKEKIIFLCSYLSRKQKALEQMTPENCVISPTFLSATDRN